MQVTIGNASVAYDGQLLTVTSVAEPHLSVRTRVDAQQVEQLIDFLDALPGDGDDCDAR